MREQERERPRVSRRESHSVWGKRYVLEVIEKRRSPAVELKHSHIFSGASGERRSKLQDILGWYRFATQKPPPPYVIAKWESLMDVKVERFFFCCRDENQLG